MIIFWIKSFRPCPAPQPNHVYDAAMVAVDDLIHRLQSSTRRPPRGVIADIVQHRANVPYMTTIFEANAEMKSAVGHVDGTQVAR
jgi:hypothetical protein